MGGRSTTLKDFVEVNVPGVEIKPTLLSSERTTEQGDGAWGERGIYQGSVYFGGILANFPRPYGEA